MIEPLFTGSKAKIKRIDVEEMSKYSENSTYSNHENYENSGKLKIDSDTDFEFSESDSKPPPSPTRSSRRHGRKRNSRAVDTSTESIDLTENNDDSNSRTSSLIRELNRLGPRNRYSKSISPKN